jgi:hypothetical protein
MKHSLGWHTVKKMHKKNKIQKAVIVTLSILLFLAVLYGFTGGK